MGTAAARAGRGHRWPAGRLLAALLVVAVALGTSVGPVAGSADGPSAAPAGTLPGTAFYPRVVRLAHDGNGGGTILATTNDGVVGRVWRSTDQGASFQLLSTVDPGPDAVGLCCIALFELPVDLGPHPAGTLLWAGSVTTAIGPPRQMDLRIWRSADHGSTWSPLSSCATSTTGGLWEPSFHVADDGSLVCLWSDETVTGHSQVLAQAVSTDGGQSWGPRQLVVVEPIAVKRPGMPTVAQLPDGTWILTYEICVAFPHCHIRFRTSDDGLDWGPVDDPGERIRTADGSYLAHTPVITWTPAGGAEGTLVLSGQLFFGPDHQPAPGNGATLLVNQAGGEGPWTPVPAPVAVPDAFDSFCPNYSSPVLDLDGQGLLLELASRWEGSDCVTGFGAARVALGPLRPSTTTSTSTPTTASTSVAATPPGTGPSGSTSATDPGATGVPARAVAAAPRLTG